MSLSKAFLTAELEAIAVSPPASVPLCAAAWADAIGTYAAGLTPPSTTVAAATAALQAALTTAFGTPGGAAALMETAFAAFGLALGTGQAPAFVATPPAVPVGFATLFTPPYPATHAAAAQGLADAIHTWMTTGTATPALGGAAVAWA